MEHRSHHKLPVLLLVCMICCFSCSSRDEVSSADVEPSSSGDFVPLFDGETLDGWSVVPAETAADWSVQEGAIVGLESADRLSYLVWKDDTLSDFELRLRYRLLTNGNSGVEIRAQPDTSGKRPFEGYHADFGHVGIGPNILGAWDFHFASRREHPCLRGTRLVIDADETAHHSEIEEGLTVEDVRRDLAP